MVRDLPDGTKYIAVSVDVDVSAVVPRPKGGELAKGSVTTTDTYAVVASHIVTDGKELQLAKILVSCPEDVMYRLKWDGTVISAEVFVYRGVPFTDWFPWDYYDMPGDGSKKFEVEVKFPSGGVAATCHVEIVGEEV